MLQGRQADIVRRLIMFFNQNYKLNLFITDQKLFEPVSPKNEQKYLKLDQSHAAKANK